jgi:hypothetical protein
MEEAPKQDRLSVIPWIILLIIVVGGFFFYKSRQDAKMKADEQQKMMMVQKDKEKKAMEEKAEKSLTVKLAEQNNSKQTGTATVEEENGKIVVTLTLTGGAFTQPQPAHFHVGTCEKPGKVVYPLTEVKNGSSKTTLDVNLGKLNDQTPLVLNVHKSDAELSVYTACGVLE